MLVRNCQHDLRPVARAGLRVGERREDLDVRSGLGDPILARDPQVEEPVLDIGRDLLRTQDAHPFDALVVDGAVIVAAAAAAHVQVRGLEEPQRLLFEGALRDHESQHEVTPASDS